MTHVWDAASASAANIYSVDENTDTITSDSRRRQLTTDAAIKNFSILFVNYNRLTLRPRQPKEHGYLVC